ncbi:MAG: hypothetical protein RIT45_46 [Pseudomonadota bacterium]
MSIAAASRSTLRRRLALLALVVAAAVQGGCSDPPIYGYVVPVADGGDWDSDGSTSAADSSAFGDAAPGEDTGAAGDGTAGTDTADVAAPKLELRYAMPDGNKDDFSGVCSELCKLQINQNGIRKLYVQVFYGGAPAANVPVKFQLADPAAAVGLGEVLLEVTLTDANGVAMTEVKSGSQVGVFDVVASLPDEDPEVVTPLFFEMHILSKAKGPLAITLHYLGLWNPIELGDVRVRLIQQQAPGQPACADLDLGDVLPSAQWESPPIGWDQPWNVTYPPFVTWVQKEMQKSGQPVSFTVIGLARTSSADSVRAGGCIDTGATVTWNPTTKALEGDSVTVLVKDLPARLKGVYDMTTYLDLLSVLPDPVEFAFKAIFDILSDPIAGLLSLACKLGSGTLDSFCGYIFENPKSPAIDDLKQPFGALIVKFLDSIILGFLPENVKAGFTAGSDIGKILTNLEMGGIIEIKKEPDQSGFLDKAHTKDEWMSVTYKWSLGQPCSPKDPACGKKTISFAQFQNEAIVGAFDLKRNALLSTIDIEKHGLLVKWGALVSFLVQKQLLPLLTGNPKVDSFEMMIKSLLAGQACVDKDTCCADFAKQLASQQSIVGESFLDGVCETLVKLGAGFIEGQLSALDTDTSKGEAMTIWTKDCPIFDDDQNMVIDTIGKSASLCKWNMTFKIGGNPVALDATFFAVRQE